LLAPKRIDISDENILVRLGATYGVLRRLGYSEEIVTRCLESVDGIDLEEAHEWVGGFIALAALIHSVPAQLFMNCTDEELHPHTRKSALPGSLHLLS
jgi:ATP-dependent RNA helicase DHX29